MKKNIAVLPGDGVGPEVTNEAVNVLKKIAGRFGHEFIFKSGLIGEAAIKKTGNPLPDETLKLCKNSDAILFGAIGDPKYDNNPKTKVRPEQGLLKLRKSLDLYINLRPVKIHKELTDISPLKKDRISGVDFVVVRELTGGIYFGKPRMRKGNTAIDTSVYTKKEIIRISEFAFDLAGKRNKKVTSVDKANVLETSRLWRETVNEVSRNYKGVTLTHMFIDNAAMQVIKNPGQFDVILTENMFGDILTDESSVLAGSIGLLPSASLGKKPASPGQGGYALYEPIHGAFNKATGQNIANPIATILSAAMLLRFSFGLEKEATAVERAVEKTLKNGFRTYDIADKNTPREKILGTKEMGDTISENI